MENDLKMGIKPTQFPPLAVEGAVSFMAQSVPSPNCVSISGDVRNRQEWNNVPLKPSITLGKAFIEKAITTV